jgi:hypothetical protein
MRHLDRLRLLHGLVPLLVACSTQPPGRTPPVAEPEVTSRLLAELAHEDQATRGGQPVTRTDQERIRLVLAGLGRGAVRTPQDRLNAALVLQHTGMTFCAGQLVSVSPDNYLLAHHLASAAFDAGLADARYLVAQTIDRYLSMTQGFQKYGTNRFTNQQTGQEEFTPIDRATTDAERAKYGVPPLAELLKQFPEQRRKPPAP